MIRFLQLNCNRSLPCFLSILETAQSSQIDILLLQELPVRKGLLPSSFPIPSASFLHAPITQNKCSSCIVVLNQSLPVVFLPRLSTTNRTLAILDIPGFHLTICSVYFPHKSSYSPIIDSFITLFGSPPPPRLIFAGDVNAVSSRWSLQKQNGKGSHINNLLDALDLKVCNTRGAITRSQGAFSSSIDISSISSALRPSISDWSSNPFDLSDHFEIRFSLPCPPLTLPSTPPPPPSPFPDFSPFRLQAQPPLALFNSLAKHFTNSGHLISTLGLCSSLESLDSLLNSFYNILFINCSSHLRTRPSASNYPPPVPWWSPQLQSLKSLSRKLRRSFQNSSPPHRSFLQEQALQAKKAYIRALHKAKRSHFRKLLECLMAFRLSHHFESNGLLHPQQFGFRRRRSTTNALSLLLTRIKRAVSRFQCCLLISLDIKSAFDHLWHPALLGRLEAASCPPTLLLLYRSFLSNRSIHFTYRGFSRSTSPLRGCAQGSVSGPLLWNIFFNPLLSLPFPPGVHVQAFADDIQILVSGPSLHLPSLAQSALDLLHSWCLDNKLSLCPPKSLVLPIFCNPPQLLINGTPLACPESLTILGVTFDDRLNFAPHLRRVCEKASSLLGRVRQCSNATSGFGFYARRRFYLGVIEPAITYAAPIWSEAAKLRAGKSNLRSVQRKFCIHAIRGFRTTPTLAAISLLRVLPLDLKVLLLSSLLRPPRPSSLHP
ncbi:hypothetical protein LAZ67_3003625 [Cordylochernes scorpioides]|uniref:Reverse transcriptase domain-containing protein n=1 Tax=Cordylochernes scorpioides TaxID=51811 RepID=A0ABY6KBI5_9ARAC|nr:hypothetical protein LAZ67_3003625 [Cordylochernes scorpioides]